MGQVSGSLCDEARRDEGIVSQGASLNRRAGASQTLAGAGEKGEGNQGQSVVRARDQGGGPSLIRSVPTGRPELDRWTGASYLKCLDDGPSDPEGRLLNDNDEEEDGLLQPAVGPRLVCSKRCHRLLRVIKCRLQ